MSDVPDPTFEPQLYKYRNGLTGPTKYPNNVYSYYYKYFLLKFLIVLLTEDTSSNSDEDNSSEDNVD